MKKILASLGVASLTIFWAIRCDNASAPAVVTPAAAVTITTPHGGEDYALFTDTILVKWTINRDSVLSIPNINSISKLFSLDSGRTWNPMAVKDGSALSDSLNYQVTWIGLDTTMQNERTFLNFTKADFLNKGIKLRIETYPPHQKIGISSGYIRFHE
jgi:hypothetical protein